jgi:hypothetical protein
MRLTCFVCMFHCLTTAFLLSQSNPVPLINQSAGGRRHRAHKLSIEECAQNSLDQPQARVPDQYGKLPLSFEANNGQTDGRVKFLSRSSGYSLFLTGDEAVLTLSGGKANPHKAKIMSTARTLQSGMAAPKSVGVLRMKLRDANPATKVTGVDELTGTSNYFIGNDPKKWRSGVPTYGKVKYEGIYSGIDLVYYGNQRQLEYDFIVAPGADPRRIAFDVSGAKRIRRDGHGDLVLKMGEGEIRWLEPVVYQQKDGTRREVPARYAIKDRNRVGFELAKYDPSRPLYIDPLIYSTFLGGSGDDEGNGIAVDSAGNAYISGITCSTDFPTKNPLQANYGGGNPYCGDAFVSKLNPSGSALVYSTYLGGNGFDGGTGIAVDSAGNAYITGSTTSTDFPITPGAFQTICSGCAYGNAFVTKISPTGTALVYSTYLGGSFGNVGNGIAVDSAGNAYVTGITYSSDFPTMNPLQAANAGAPDAFVTKINPAGSALVYSTYLGGFEQDYGMGVAVDNDGNAYVTGSAGPGFPTTPGAFKTCCGFSFAAKINPTGTTLVYSSYLDNNGTGIAVDGVGNAYVAGWTLKSRPSPKRDYAFVTKINSTGSALVYSIDLGNSGGSMGSGIAVDSMGNAYVTGWTRKGVKTYANAFMTKMNPTGSALVYSADLGGSGNSGGTGIAVDATGNAYITGYTESTNFPTLNAVQPANAGGADAFVTKINPLATTTTTLSSSLNPSTYGQELTFTAVVTSGLGAPLDGEPITFMKGTKVLGTGTLSGGSASFTTSTLPAGTDYIKAVYSGDSNFAASTSKAVSQVVSKATTTTALTSSLNPSNVGQSVTFTATVTPQFSSTVKGSVTFYDGTTAVKTVALSGGAAKFTTAALTSGSHTITATYNGSTSFTGSSASLTQTVN